MAADVMCDICNERPALISDGIVGAELCERLACLDAAWERAYPPGEES